MPVENQFEIEDGILKAYTGVDAEICVPEGVHTLGDGVFKGMSWLKKVRLPETLKKIGATAFKGCRLLREINIPEGLTEVGDYAFHRCHDLEEMIFSKSMTHIGSNAFLYCDGLKRVVMEGPERLGAATFSHDLSLQEICLNKYVDFSNFSEEVFEGCVNLRKISLSDEIYGVDNLIEAMESHAAYPEVIKAIAKSVYHSLDIEDGVLSRFNINLKSVVLPEGITAIGKGCFFDKKGIVVIVLPKSLKEIRANAFLNCFNLEEITIQNEELSLDDKAFRGCNNLKKIHLRGESYLLDKESSEELVCRIRDQVMGDFYISGKTMLRYMGNEEQIQIPKGIEIIGERCFFGREQLKTVICPEGLLEIREEAFAGCLTLQNIVLPESLKRVEREAFGECKKLLKCNLPKTLEYIGEYAFRRCFALKPFDPFPEKAKIHEYAFYKAKQFTGVGANNRLSLDVTDHVGKRIEKYAFVSRPDLEELVIDDPELVIEQNAFSRCPNLRKVQLHVKALGRGCFSYCRNLEEVSLSGVSVLPAECFIGCYQLSRFEAGEITRMEARCFDECIHLDSFDFSGIRVIGERAFERCDSLKKVELHQTECGYHAFADCASLETVKLSKDTNLKSGAFIGCTQIKTIVYDTEEYHFNRFSDGLNHAGNPYPYPVREVIASIYSCFSIRERKILEGYTQYASEITVPEDIEEIGQDVFREQARLKTIHIPKNVKSFGSHAFSMTAWLDEQRKKSDMVIINDILLDGAMCKGKVVIPSTVKKVASWCFAGNIYITELVISSERTGIEELSFRNCLNLKKITDWKQTEYTLRSVMDIKEKEYPALIRRIFSECINCFKLDENGNLVESTGNITELVFPEGIRSVGDGVYKDCHLLECIVLSTDTERIGKSAFENSKWLRSVDNAGNVSCIGTVAFSGCQSLESIDLSDHLREIGNRCFEHCSSLKEIHLSEQLHRIPERAFFRCKSLKKLIIPKSVKVIAKEAFAFCEGLEEVWMAEETQLEDRAFAYCERLKIKHYSQ